MRTIILVLTNLAVVSSYPSVSDKNLGSDHKYVAPGVYGRDPTSTGGMSCFSPLDCDGGIGLCDKAKGFNGTVCICPEKYTNVDCSHERLFSAPGIFLVIMGPFLIGYIYFMVAFPGFMLGGILSMFFMHMFCLFAFLNSKVKFFLWCIFGMVVFDITFGIMVMTKYYTDNDGYEMYSK
jgi:hypothetical protein